MTINNVNNYNSIANGYMGSGGTSNDMTNQNVFFQILAAELSNQDPLKGKDGTEYVSQLAQFTALEQTEKLYTTMTRVLMSSSITEAGMMIGKEVEFAVKGKDGTYATEKGVVKSVKIEGGQVYLITDKDKKYSLEQSVGFTEPKVETEPDEKPEEVKPDAGNNGGTSGSTGK